MRIVSDNGVVAAKARKSACWVPDVTITRDGSVRRPIQAAPAARWRSLPQPYAYVDDVSISAARSSIARDGTGTGVLTMFVARSMSSVMARLAESRRAERTNVPRPVDDSTSPRRAASAYARVTVTGVIPSTFARSRCVGS